MGRRRARRGRRDGLFSAAAAGLALLVCFASVVRLLYIVGAGAAFDGVLLKAAADGGFVSAAFKMETGVLPELYTQALGSQSGLAAAAADLVVSEASSDAEKQALPQVGALQQAGEKTLTDQEADAAQSGGGKSRTDKPEASQTASPAAGEETGPESESPAAESPAPAESEVPAQQTEAASEEASADAGGFTEQDAANIAYTNATAYTPDDYALLTEPLTIDFSAQGPLVLIIHTHASEAYTPEYEGQYADSDSYRTQDLNYSVVKVGDELETLLSDAGIEVLHDRTVNDYPSYNGSYTRTLSVLEDYLRQYPSIQIVIDLHRDSALDENGQAAATYYEEDGVTASQVMLVVGTDEGSLPHPDWRENLKLALRLQAAANRSHPGLMRPINLRQERFNEHVTAGSLITEVGFSGNTLSQALAAVRLFGQSLKEVIVNDSLH